MPLPVGLVDACDDPRLFGVELYPKQRDRLAGSSRSGVAGVGARTACGQVADVFAGRPACGLLRPELLERLGGERGYAVAIATNLRQARLIAQAARSVIEHSPLLAEMVESVTEDVVYFTNGTAFAAFPCSSRGGRGWPIFFLAMDEAAHFLTETDGPAVADKVFEALAPAQQRSAILHGSSSARRPTARTASSRLCTRRRRRVSCLMRWRRTRRQRR